jgi:hypothetical protein
MLRSSGFAESVESDGEISFDASSGSDGGRRRERRSFSKDGAFVSSLDDEDEDEAAAADLRAFSGYGITPTPNGRFTNTEHNGCDNFATCYSKLLQLILAKLL